jgi:streptomycin 6-kinase
VSSWPDLPAALRESHRTYYGDVGGAWDDGAPALAARVADQWGLRPDGPASHGAVAWILPVRRTDGTPAVLKLQPLDAETAGEPVALRAWDGDGAVRLLEHDPDSGVMLLERLGDATLGDVPDDHEATAVIADLLAHLHRQPAPDGLRRLDDILADLLVRADAVGGTLPDDVGNTVLDRCAAVGRELAREPAGDRLLHWDLHYANVLASTDPARGPWLAIDPKPLVGHPGFELLAALHNRWDDVVRGGEPHLLQRFEILRDGAGLDRGLAAAWTCVRVLEDLVWEAESPDSGWSAGPDRVIGQALLPLVG